MTTQRQGDALAVMRPPQFVNSGQVPGGQATSELTPELIEERVQRFQTDHADLFKRMDADQALYDLVEYNSNADGTHTFPSYTSNSPRVYAKKVTALLTAGDLFIRMPHDEALREDRDRYDVKERFFYGVLAAADERLLRRLEVRLKGQLAWYAAIRGYICVRATLVKTPDGRTYPDIRPLDPRNAAWSVDYEGVEWAAYTTRRTAADLRSQYGLDLGGRAEQLYEVIDYYDRRQNAVVVRGHGFVKPPTVHGSREVMIYIVPVGPAPDVQPAGSLLAGQTSGYGESIFAENRLTYKYRNHILSIYLALVQKARDRSYVLYSPDGSTTLKDNPNEGGGVIPLAIPSDLKLVDIAETTKDSAVLAQFVTEEMHFGSLSKTSYGDVPFQLSGFAINSLRQSVFSVLQPILDAIQDAYLLLLNGLADQYATNAFDTMTLSGHDTDRNYFSATITPDAIRGLPSPVVKLVAELPQDSLGNINMAQQARGGPDGVPLLPDDYILDHIVGVQDVGATQDAIKEQAGERLSPRARFKTTMDAMERRGRPDLAAIYLGELMVQQLQQMIALAQGKLQAQMVGQAAQQVGGPPGTGGGMPPEVLPAAAQGQPPPRPTPQAGPLVPPGAPRPGAQGSPY